MPRIQVGIRAKPHHEEALAGFTAKNGKGEAMAKIEITVNGNKTEFSFDNYFGDSCTQEEVFETCGRQVADEVLDGKEIL